MGPRRRPEVATPQGENFVTKLLQLRHMKPVVARRGISRQSRMGQDRSNLLRSLAIDRGGARVAPPPRVWPGRLLLGLAGLLGLLAGAWAFAPHLRVGGRAAEPVSAPAEAVRSAQKPTPSAALTEAQAISGLAASGYVVARRKATVAAEVTGKVVELLVEEGMVVEAGQIVARLDSLLAETDLTLAQSRAAAAEAAAAAVAADLADAERILSRIRSLSQKSVASEADLTKAEARVGILRAQLSQAQAQKQTAQLDVQRNATVLDKHKIRAPFGGIVVERSAQPGEMISPISAGGGFTRTGICTIVDMDSIEIEVDVNEAFIGRVRTGGAISAVLDAYPDWTIPATVVAVVPTANREKATVKVRIALKQKDPRVLPDMAVKVRFHEEESAAAAPTAEAVSASK
jgi:HlyD family secretion protein